MFVYKRYHMKNFCILRQNKLFKQILQNCQKQNVGLAAFGRWDDTGADAEHGEDPATLGPKLPHHIQSATNAQTTSISLQLKTMFAVSVIYWQHEKSYKQILFQVVTFIMTVTEIIQPWAQAMHPYCIVQLNSDIHPP